MSHVFQTLSSEQQHRLLDGAVLVSQEEHRNTFYDTDTFYLTSTNRWLRRNNDEFELKIPIARTYSDSSMKDRFVQVTMESQIRSLLRLDEETDTLENDIAEAGFAAFCIAQIIKSSYVKDALTVDVYRASYDNSDYTYVLTEPHRTRNDQTLAEKIAQAGVHGGAALRIVTQYLKHCNEVHYSVLVANHVIS